LRCNDISEVPGIGRRRPPGVPGLLLDDAPMQLGRQSLNLPGDLGVGLQGFPSLGIIHIGELLTMVALTFSDAGGRSRVAR
jgi:hypothetical protein